MRAQGGPVGAAAVGLVAGHVPTRVRAAHEGGPPAPGPLLKDRCSGTRRARPARTNHAPAWRRCSQSSGRTRRRADPCADAARIALRPHAHPHAEPADAANAAAVLAVWWNEQALHDAASECGMLNHEPAGGGPRHPRRRGLFRCSRGATCHPKGTLALAPHAPDAGPGRVARCGQRQERRPSRTRRPGRHVRGLRAGAGRAGPWRTGAHADHPAPASHRPRPLHGRRGESASGWSPTSRLSGVMNCSTVGH